MDIAAWLRKLGLERYAQVFQENEIDAEILPKLNADDLKDIGVAAVGHRRKLLEAIAPLAEPASTPPAELSAPVSGALRARATEAERRQLTVMFVDLVGSTALSSKLDPEEMREVIHAYQNAVVGEIARFAGHVAKFMGDGVLAYFGWPRAHEDEAERAVRAGLSIMRLMADMKAPAGEPLAARAGIATGLVVVGDLIGEGAAQEEAVVGETPNLAARLQGLAEPGQIVLAESTRRLLGDLFELVDLGAHELKGFGAPVAAFAVGAERSTQSRFEARSGPALLPMVGRDQELALLLERWALAKVGEGQGVLLVGEAGIGKSRISRALLDALAEEPHTRIRYQCSPYHTDSALWPVIQQLSHAAGLSTDDPVEAQLDKLEALLDQAGGRDAAPLIAELIGLSSASRYGALDLTSQARRACTLEALVKQLLGLAAQQPVLVVQEDAHWIDPSTLELIAQCLDRTHDHRVLILLTSRPDNQPELAAHPHITRLTLNRLGRAGVEAIVTRLGGEDLPTETIDAIIARTDGVPLFVEELTKAMLETGETAIPASLHDSLMARLDRIPEVKEIAQIAACIGREFDVSLLAAVADRPEPDLQCALDKLATAELIFRRGTPSAATYTFKHALVRDAAHESLLRSNRRQVHATIARTLEVRFQELVDNEPELLARHCSEAELVEPALHYWLRAADRSLERFANSEAIDHATQGLKLIDRQPPSEQRARLELRLQFALGAACRVVKGYAAPETERAFTRAIDLAEVVGDEARLVEAARGQGSTWVVQGRVQPARTLAERVVANTRSPEHMMIGQMMIGQSAVWEGDLLAAREVLEQTLSLYDPNRPLSGLSQQIDPGNAAMLFLSFALVQLGYADQAVRADQDAFSRARASSQPFGLAQALSYTCWVKNILRQRTTEEAEALQAIAQEHGMFSWKAWATYHGGFGAWQDGQIESGLRLMRDGIAQCRKTHSLISLPLLIAGLAQAYLTADAFDAAGQALSEGFLLVERNGERHYEAELHRLGGTLLLKRSPPKSADAEGCFRRALDIAHTQSAKLLELRAATSLARLWRDQGRRIEARDLLTPIYDWFTEGFDTADLKDAKALLDELR